MTVSGPTVQLGEVVRERFGCPGTAPSLQAAWLSLSKFAGDV